MKQSATVLSDNSEGSTPSRTYLVGPILRACEVMKAFRSPGESLALCDLVARTRLNKTTVFRAAQSLVAGGLLERINGNHYRCLLATIRSKPFRVGYAGMAENSLMSREITASIRFAAVSAGLELVEVDNHLSARVAVRNSERLIRDEVNLAIEFQVHQKAAAAIASNFAKAGIPLIAIHTPHPGAVFFGGNNYLAGRIGGRALARWALNAWDGKVDSILLLGHVAAGPLTNSRLTGTAIGISEILQGASAPDTFNIDVKGGYAEAMDLVLKHLSRSRASRILVGCINDAAALGALRAFAEAGRSEHCAVVGQNGTAAARVELRQPNSRLIGSVGFFPEKYGEHILSLAVDMLQGKSVPPATFIKHALLTRQNVNDYYSNDALAVLPGRDALLFSRYH